MSAVCDHCGGALSEPSHGSAAWCATCVRDDNELLNGAKMSHDGGKTLMTFPPSYGEISVGFTENIAKLKAIPPKASKKAPLPTIAEVLVQIKEEKQASSIEEKLTSIHTILPFQVAVAHTAKDKRKKVRSGIALGMLVNRTGLGQTFKDKRAHRSKDYKHSWKREWE